MFRNLAFRLILNLIKIESQLPLLGSKLILSLRIWRSLLEIAYILQNQQGTYFYIVKVIARPQIIEWFPNIDYFICAMCVCYLFNIILFNKWSKYITLVVIIFNTNFMNFFFELSKGIASFPAQICLSIMYLLNTFVVTGKLDVDTNNFEITKNNFIQILGNLINVFLMVSQIYIQNEILIMMIATVSAILQLFQQIFINPFKEKVSQTIISTIYLTTIYLSILQFLSIHSDFTVEFIIFPFLTKLTMIWIQLGQRQKIKKFDQILLNYEFEKLRIVDQSVKPSEISDRIIYGSIMMKQQQYFQALLYLKNIKCEELVTQVKLEQLQQKCLQLIETKLQSNTLHQNQMYLAVKSLMESEDNYFKIIQDIIQLIKDKLETYQHIIDNKNNSLEYILKYTRNLLNLKEKLEFNYDQYPCDKTQNILGYLQAEIMNDFFATNKLFNLVAISDEKLKRKGLISDYFSNKMIYLITNYNQNGLYIKRFSNNAPYIIGLASNELFNTNINFLIPNGVYEWHNDLITQFMDKGDSKYLRKLAQNFYQTHKEGYIQSIEFAIDINFVKELTFICFIEPSLFQPMILILNKNKRVTDFSKQLLIQINLNNVNLINQKIYEIIPQFDHNQQCQENIEAFFGKDTKQSCSSQQYNYITTITTIYKNLDDQIIYYYIFFEFLRKKQNINSARNSLMIKNMSIEESIDIKIPNNMLEDSISSESQPGIQIDVPIQNLITIQSRDLQLETQKLDTQRNRVQQSFLRNSRVQPSEEQLDEESSNNKKDQKNHQEDNAQNDAASQISSLLGISKSKYYKKYKILINLNELEYNSKNHKILIILFTMTFVIQIIFGIVQLAQINKNIRNLVSDIDLLQIKNLVYQPLESFLVTRWTIGNYNNLRDDGSITPLECKQLSEYPQSNLALGYDQLYSNVVSVLNRQELQPLLQDSYLIVYLYISTGLGEPYNLTLRNCIDILLNYQYQFKMAFILDGSAVADSPYVYYSYRNYKTFKNIFSQLNEQVLEQTIYRCTAMSQQSSVLFIIQIIVLLLMILWIYQRLRIIYDRFGKYFEALLSIDHQALEQEIYHLKQQLEQIQKQQDYLFKYTFSLEEYEQMLQQYSSSSNDEYRKKQRKQQTISINSYLWNFFFIILLVIVGENCFLTFYQTYAYLDKYPETARFYKQVSDVGTDVPTMFAQREVLYGRHYFTYFNDSDFAAILDEVIQAMERTKIFTNEGQNFNKLLLSQSFRDYYLYLQNHDLCQELPQSIKEKSQAICQITLNSNMNRGLKLVLVYIVNLIQTDMDINQFTEKINPAYQELEGVFQVSELIRKVNIIFNKDLNEQTISLLYQLTAYNIVVLILISLVILFGLTVFKQTLLTKFYLVQQIIYLAPRKTLFFDDAFERNVRNLFAIDLKI